MPDKQRLDESIRSTRTAAAARGSRSASPASSRRASPHRRRG
jgi:hypothetical protein